MELVVHFDDFEQAKNAFGPGELHVKALREKFNVRLIPGNDFLKIIGDRDKVNSASRAFSRIVRWVESKGFPDTDCLSNLIADRQVPAKKNNRPPIYKGAVFSPKTEGQKTYVKAISSSDLVFSIGPAGTGKTYIAVAKAVEALKTGQVKKIILVRPAIEAGEKLGFLPGDYVQKINPYLRPLLDALGDFFDMPVIKRYMDNDLLELAPLAYMRGRTLNGAYVILDEAQNTTETQMKMFLTRLGADSKMVVTGDVTQVDLPNSEWSGLIKAVNLLEGLQGISIVRLNESDIVRHNLVARILDRYNKRKEN